jgi:hypothetical protein
MKVKKIRHVILANEINFTLCWMKDDTSLQVSQAYSVQSEFESDREDALCTLSYFLTLAMFHHQLGGFRSIHGNMSISPPTSTLMATSSNHMGTTGLHSSRHYRSDSDTTIVGLPSSITYTRLAKYIDLRLWVLAIPKKSWQYLLSNVSPAFPEFCVMWKTSKWKMTPTDELLCEREKGLLCLGEMIHYGWHSSVFRGLLNNKPIVAKYTDCSSRPILEHEYMIYHHLHSLQGSSIPRCLGLYRVGDDAGYMLLMEDCGNKVKSLTCDNRYVVL